ncbi:MAG TPA: helix-turn-helix transcriptional regulator [Thermoanaerobaculia bacterium]|nr:helix-turn-helix transcriptional regulator [Thermoanaerobaculia bacterium]
MPKARRVDPDAVLFGAIINRLRTERGWSLVKLGLETGMNPTHLGVLERGGNTPNLTTILIFGAVFGVESAELVREVEQASRKRVAQARAARQARRGKRPSG